MQIAADHVVSFHYDLSLADGTAIESSRARGNPIAALIGHGGVVKGLEEALLGKSAGERFDVLLPPSLAYGERDPEAIARVPKKRIEVSGSPLKPGAIVMVETERGQRAAVVMKVGLSVVDLDLNHPLAGQVLRFDIEVLEVRAATAEELAHGHVHGPGGVHH
jgi:FKBP-type peptidyl-prolyl cis-trans isomerase SlyD